MRAMKVREKTGFSFFTVVEYTSHDDEWPDFHEDREGYKLAEEKWQNAIDEVMIQEDLFVDDGSGWNFPKNNYGLNDDIFPNKPPIPGTPHFIAEEKYRAKCERTYSWGRYYASFNETGIRMRSFVLLARLGSHSFP